MLGWTKDFSVHNEELDKHHKELFSILNATMEDVMLKGKDTARISADLIRLKEYSESHFKAEEDMFRRKNFPDEVQHIREHEEFRRELQRIEELLRKNDELVRLELMKFLASWFAQHVLISDKKYISYITT